MWNKKSLSRRLKKTRYWDLPGVQTLGYLVDAEPESPRPDRLGPAELFAQIVELIQSTGLACVYVLVDRTDEAHSLSGRPDRTCRMLVPLMAELPLLEVPGSAFKFFLPTAVTEELAKHPGIRFDRIPLISLKWTPEQLRILLAQRLSEFSNGVINTIDQLCEADFRESIEENLIRAANGMPRNMLRIANQLVVEHCYYNNDKLLIQRQDWEETRSAPALSDIFGG